MLQGKELGRASDALGVCIGRPSKILLACEGEQRERYLLEAALGERMECVAMTEPDRLGPARYDDHGDPAGRRPSTLGHSRHLRKSAAGGAVFPRSLADFIN